MRSLRDLKLASQADSGIKPFLSLLVFTLFDYIMTVTLVIIVIIVCYGLLLLRRIFCIIELF